MTNAPRLVIGAADPVLDALVERYLARIRATAPAFVWSDRHWYRDGRHARAWVLGDPGCGGFAIVGSGPFIDQDVASEVCEFFADSPWMVLPLARACLSTLIAPWGFQVDAENGQAQRVFAGILRRQGMAFQNCAADEQGRAVWRYRIVERSPLWQEPMI